MKANADVSNHPYFRIKFYISSTTPSDAIKSRKSNSKIVSTIDSIDNENLLLFVYCTCIASLLGWDDWFSFFPTMPIENIRREGITEFVAFYRLEPNRKHRRHSISCFDIYISLKKRCSDISLCSCLCMYVVNVMIDLSAYQ